MRDTLSKMGNAFYTRRMASYWRQGMDTTEAHARAFDNMKASWDILEAMLEAGMYEGQAMYARESLKAYGTVVELVTARINRELEA